MNPQSLLNDSVQIYTGQQSLASNGLYTREGATHLILQPLECLTVVAQVV